MRTVAASWKVIEEVLRENANSVFRALRKPASRGDLKRLAAAFPRHKLPSDLLQSLAIHDGLDDSYLGNNRLFDYWALLPAAAMVDAAKVQRDRMEMLKEDGVNRRVKPGGPVKTDLQWRDGWIPFMDAGGDKLVIDLDPGPRGRVGQVIKFYNAENRLPLIAPSFRAWLSTLADRLGPREFQLDEYGGISIEDDDGLAFPKAKRR
jgi:cell wall assembly regulator SMI1